MNDTDEIIAIGSKGWNDELRDDHPNVLRTGSPLLGRQLSVDQLRIEPAIAEHVTEAELNWIRTWVTEVVLHKFEQPDSDAAHRLLAAHGLVGS